MSSDLDEGFSFPAADGSAQSRVTPLVEADVNLSTFQNVLILIPDGEPADEHACRFLSTNSVSADQYIRIGEDTVGQIKQRWTERNQEEPANVHLLSTNPNVNDYAETTYDTQVITDGDLSGTGIAVSRVMNSIPKNEQTTLCFSNLTTFCLKNDDAVLFRFLHLLTSRVLKQQIQAHYHLDPTRFSNEQLSMLFEHFDIVITYHDGDWLFKHPD